MYVLAYWRVLANGYLSSETSTYITLYILSPPCAPHVYTSALFHTLCTSCYLPPLIFLIQRSATGIIIPSQRYLVKRRGIALTLRVGFQESNSPDIA